MAKQTDNKLSILGDKDRQELEALGDRIAKSEKVIALAEKLGLGVGDYKAQLELAKKRREILLAEG